MARVRLASQAISLTFCLKDLTLHCSQLTVKQWRFSSPADEISYQVDRDGYRDLSMQHSRQEEPAVRKGPGRNTRHVNIPNDPGPDG